MMANITSFGVNSRRSVVSVGLGNSLLQNIRKGIVLNASIWE